MDLTCGSTVRKAVPRIAYGLFRNARSHNPVGKERRASWLVIRATNSGDHPYDSDHRMVDASMIVLRKRIFELRLKERENDEPPSEWMEWEKKMYSSYQYSVFVAVAWFQYFLVTARPSVAVAILSLVFMSVPTSVFLVTSASVQSVGELWQDFSQFIPP